MTQKTQLQRIIEILTKKLGHIPTQEEIATELNGTGLMTLLEQLRLEDNGQL